MSRLAVIGDSMLSSLRRDIQTKFVTAVIDRKAGSTRANASKVGEHEGGDLNRRPDSLSRWQYKSEEVGITSQ